VCTKKRGIDRERRGGEKEREEEEEEGRLGEIETGTEGWSDEEGGRDDYRRRDWLNTLH
jgi:hypothetical protein